MYEVRIESRAKKQLEKLPFSVSDKLYECIQGLSREPRPQGCKKLSNSNYRIRQGDYRIVYQIFDKEIVVKVLEVGHRKEVYRR